MDFTKNINNRQHVLNIDVSGISMNGLEGDYLTPAGQISFFARISAPLGWLECNGDTFDPNIYVDLSNAIGDTWGNNNYKLPDFRNKFLRTWDNGKNIDTNRQFASLQSPNQKKHTHNLSTQHSHNISLQHGGGHTHQIWSDHSDYWDFNGYRGPSSMEQAKWNTIPSQNNFYQVRMPRSGSHGSYQEAGAHGYGMNIWTYITSEHSAHRHYYTLNNSTLNITIDNSGSSISKIKNKNLLCCIKY